MRLVMLLLFFIIKPGLPKDIKDLNLPELIQLGEDTSQVRPLDVTESDVSFFLFSRNVSSVKLDYSTNSALDLSKPVKFIIHGYIENHGRLWYKGITEEYLKHGDYNIIQVDWERPSRSSYASAAFNTRFVGNIIAGFILSQKMPLENVHLIGHSLGSHVAGFAGKSVIESTGQKLYRITGLDPAGPYFNEFFISEDDRLDKNDAKIVDNLHTDAGFYGYSKPIGTLDMYFNGGSRLQPGCLETFDVSSIGGVIQHAFCSHARSHEYFTDSINNGKIHCRKCSFLEEYTNEDCKNNDEYVLGAEDVTTSTIGVCYAKTNSKSPYFK